MKSPSGEARTLVYDILLVLMGELSVLHPGSAINRLHFACSPSAILRGIVTIHVNAVKRSIWITSFMRFKTLTHILIKYLERIPSLANLYTSSTVVLVVPFIRIVTPCLILTQAMYIGCL